MHKIKNIFVLLDSHHSRSIITMTSLIKKNKNNFYNMIFLGNDAEYKFFKDAINEKILKQEDTFINFNKISLKGEKKIASNKNINKKSKNFLKIILKNIFKDTSIYSFIIQILIYRRLINCASKARNIIKKYKPIFLLTINDRKHDDMSASFFVEAKKVNIPIILFNINIYSKEAAFGYRLCPIKNTIIRNLDVKKYKNLYEKYSLFFLKNCIYKGSLYQSREHLLAHKMFGSLSKFPWFNGRGMSDLVIASNGMDELELIDNGVSPKKIVTLGHPEYSSIYKNFKNNKKIRKKIFIKYNFKLDKDLIVAALPQWFEQGVTTFEEHQKKIKFYIDSISKTNKNILLSLHPRQNINDYIFLESKNIKISSDRLSSIISCCDLFITNISSTIIWSVLLGTPCIVFNPFKVEYPMFKKFRTIKIASSKKRFLEYLNNVKFDESMLQSDWTMLKRKKVFSESLSSKYIQLFDTFLEERTN